MSLPRPVIPAAVLLMVGAPALAADKKPAVTTVALPSSQSADPASSVIDVNTIAVALAAVSAQDDGKCLNNGSKGNGKALGHCKKSPD